MTCERAQELFSDYHEGTLAPGLRQELERHLDQDPACSHQYQLFKAMLNSFECLPPVEVPSDLQEKVSQRLDRLDWESKQGKSAGTGWLRLALYGASAALVLSLGYLGYDQISGSGVEASPVAFKLAAEPLSIAKIGNEVRVRVTPAENTDLRISLGGTDSALPPSDSVVVRDYKLEPLQQFNQPLTDNGGERAIVYVKLSTSAAVTAIVFPNTKSSPSGLLATLCDISTRHNVVIEARLTGAPQGGATSNLGVLAGELDQALEGTSYSYKIEGDLVRIR